MERIENEAQKTSQTVGAVVFIVDSEGRLYTQMEMEDRASTGKKIGEYSTICETRLPNEKWHENVIRGILEETGIDIGQLPLVLNFSKSKTWEAQFIKGADASVVVIPCTNTEMFLSLVNKSSEHDGVVPIGFLPYQDFVKLNLRQGVKNVLSGQNCDILRHE